MLTRLAALLCVSGLSAITLSAQGLDTKASKDDWEEVNFEYNSSVLVDGFPSLLRLSELLQKNPGYKVKVEGHTDVIGGGPYNDKLGMARANTVRDFLVKYGARPSQIDVSTRGKVDPKYPGQKNTYTKTDEARWMNRRVVITVMDDQGRTVSADAGVGQAIRSIEQPKPTGGMTDCCNEVLKRLDKLDDIAKLLQNLADQNAQLRRDLDALKQAQQVLESKANQPSGPPAPTKQDVAQAVAAELDKNKQPKFQLLGVNVGMDQNGDVTGTGRGRFFGPFGEHYAFQAQGEFLYFKGQKEGQIDIGLVDRIGRFQAGLFSSFKHVSLSGNQTGGTLGQASATLDYLFKWGKVGVFGTYAFMDNALINSQAAVLQGPNGVLFTSPDVLENRYLKVVNQAGASFSAGLWGNNYVEGNIGYLKSFVYGDRIGGTARFVFPLNDKIAFTVEGDLNPTMLGAANDGRAVVGVQFGNAIRPKEMLASNHAVPVDVPRVRYEVITKTVRVGHTAPVADAGPDQIGVPAGPITLNGSASYSPDGLPLTYRWIQEGGPTVTLTSPTSAITSFPAAGGTAYVFRLVVTDSLGASSQARVHVTTATAEKPQILFFNANPTTIQSGQSSTLAWRVLNATTVNISSIGNVQPQGSAPVSPTQTTTYTLTATNANGSDTATATITVSGSVVNVTYCYASPANITVGESSTIFFATTNANSVTINNGVGTVGANGSVVVSPTSSTTYTVTANGPNGTSASCSAAVQVTTGQVPRIIRFSAAPQSIVAGQSSTLFWVVENATTVSISNGLGNVSLGGSQDVTPGATTTYTLTATNAAGSVTSQATVNVSAAVKITSFTATPNPSTAAGAAVALACTATGSTNITLNGVTTAGTSATATVNPQATTTYTCVATGPGGGIDQQSLTVTVPTGGGGGGGNQGPTIVVNGGLTQTTTSRFITLDASKSTSPSGNNPLTFLWESVNDRATISSANQGITPAVLGGAPTVPGAVQPGSYVFKLTVIDSKGNTATAIVTFILQI
jgi:hypothetical protein